MPYGNYPRSSASAESARQAPKGGPRPLLVGRKKEDSLLHSRTPRADSKDRLPRSRPAMRRQLGGIGFAGGPLKESREK